MVNFYLDKIRNNIINQNTNSAWTVNDVPKLWKAKVQKELKAKR